MMSDMSSRAAVTAVLLLVSIACGFGQSTLSTLNSTTTTATTPLVVTSGTLSAREQRRLDGLSSPLPFFFAAAPAGAANNAGQQQNKVASELPVAKNERDRFIMSVFEALLSTMDAKLRRVENLDKAVEHMMRKMETLYSRVNRNIEKTDQVLAKMRASDTKLFSVGNGRAVESVDVRLASIDDKISLIDSKLNSLAEAAIASASTPPTVETNPSNNNGKRTVRITKLAPSSTSFSTVDEILNIAASERRAATLRPPVSQESSVFANKTSGFEDVQGSGIKDHVRRSAQRRNDLPLSTSDQLTDDMAVVKDSVNRIEARLTTLTGVIWPKLGYLIRSVSDIHGAIIDDFPAQEFADGEGGEASESVDYISINGTSTTSTTSRPTSTTSSAASIEKQRKRSKSKGQNRQSGAGSTSGSGSAANGRSPGGNNRLSRIDKLITRVDPLATVSQKMDEVWNVVVGTKSTVDNLVPKSQQLLDKTQRQERAISIIHTDLTNMADQIIGNLYEVEKTLKNTGSTSGKLSSGLSKSKFFQDVKDLPPGARDTLLDELGHFIHSDVDSLPLLPISEPSAVPTGTNHLRTQLSSSKETEAGPSQGNNQPGDFQNIGQFSPFASVPHGRSPSVVFPSIQRKPTLSGSNTSTESALRDQAYKAYSCGDLYKKGVRTSGIYYVQIRGTTYWYLKVFCNMEVAEGGWTVIQRRDDYGEPRESFNRDWDDYKHGFGDVAKEFWLGNENIFMLTNSEESVLRIELEDFDGNKRWAEYATFKLYSEKDHYKLVVGGYEGNAGDALNDPWYGSNLSPFSTFNRDNDRSSLNCASMLKGGWWWRSCGRGLNGLYITDPNDLQARQGIVWFRWRGWDYTLRRASLMIRPKSFLSSANDTNSTTAEQ